MDLPDCLKSSSAARTSCELRPERARRGRRDDERLDAGVALRLANRVERLRERRPASDQAEDIGGLDLAERRLQRQVQRSVLRDRRRRARHERQHQQPAQRRHHREANQDEDNNYTAAYRQGRLLTNDYSAGQKVRGQTAELAASDLMGHRPREQDRSIDEMP